MYQKWKQLWNDWQLNSVVLLSLFLQLLLLSTGSRRRRMRPSKLNKTYFWILYNLSSPIPIYVLGVLPRSSVGHAADANKKDVSGPAACTKPADPSPDGIQAFWAALLLFHLGGVDDFTALSLEDNNLWDRRVFSLSIQAATTIYVFFHYFQDSSFRVFIAPFWLIFLAGVFKCVEQVLALRQATMKALIGSVLGIPDPGPDYADTMDRVDGILRSGKVPHLNIDNERVDPPNSELNKDESQQAVKIIRSAHFLFSRFSVLFADGIFSFKHRQDSRAEFSSKDVHWAFKVVEIELSFVYDRLYTKASVSRTMSGLLVRVSSLLLTIAGSIWALFMMLQHASRYPVRHRCVTYTLLLGAVVTDVATLALHSFSIWSVRHSGWPEWCSDRLVNGRVWWSGYIAQRNLITFCLQELPSEFKLLAHIRRGIRAKPLAELPMTTMIRGIFSKELREGLLNFRRPLLQKLLARSFWRNYGHTKHVPVGEDLKAFIFEEIRKKEKRIFNDCKWKSQGQPADISDSSSPPFTADRGDQVLRNENIVGLEWSLQEREFDESLLIWHIATDLCFRQGQQDDHDQADTCGKHMDMARELSNYLFYIMVVHPLMLSPPTTMAIKRCQDTCAEARRHFLKEHAQHLRRPTTEARVTEENAHRLLLKVDTPLRAAVVKGDKSKSVLWDGCFLARELARVMPERERRWRVVCRVWVEMLCYAAVHCGGYQHAERLKEGGELLTFVCLLMTHLGMGKHYRTEVGDAYAHLSAYTV